MEPQPKQLNFNTLISTIAVLAIVWVGNRTSANNDSLTKIETQLPYVNASMAKLDSQIAQMVTRAELESRFSELQARGAAFDKRLMLLEFEKKKPLEP